MARINIFAQTLTTTSDEEVTKYLFIACVDLAQGAEMLNLFINEIYTIPTTPLLIIIINPFAAVNCKNENVLDAENSTWINNEKLRALGYSV